MAAVVVSTESTPRAHAVNEYSFLELVEALTHSGESTATVMRAVVELVEEGQIRLVGSLRGLPLNIVRRAVLVQN